MIYRLFRKEIASRTPQLMTDSCASESKFLQELSKFIKLMKKKQVLYLRILEASNYGKRRYYEEEQDFVKEFEGYLLEGNKIEGTILEFQSQGFSNSKTYFYTTFMRIREVLQVQARRFKIEGKDDICQIFEEGRSQVTQMYTNMAYLQNYRLKDLMEFIIKHQNKRLSQNLPKRSPSLAPIERPNKLLEKLKSPSAGISFLRKTISVELAKGKQANIEDIVNQKLIVRQLATQKRLQERNKPKKKQNLFKLYDILQLRSTPLDRFMNMKDQLQQNMMERNRYIKESVKQYEKRYLLNKFCKKDKK